MDNKNRSAGYVRVSTLQQADSGTSIDEQKRTIEKESNHRGLNLIKIYSDEGISGKSIKRPALKEMLEDAKKGAFDIILFTKLDRLARNLRDTLNIYHETNELGIDMICIDDPVISTNGPMGSVMLSIMGTFAQFERELIRSRTSAGRLNKWKSGESIMGHLPFGYKKNQITKNIEIDNYKKDIILKVYNLYLIERLSMIDIANRLTEEGFKTPSSLNGRKDASSSWNMNTIREILTNRCYTGETIPFNKYKFVWNENNHLVKTKEEKPNSEWINLSFPAILEKQLFLDAQQKISYSRVVSKRTSKDSAEKFLTLHILRCGECRSKISKQTSGSREYMYYTCPWRKSSEKRLRGSNKKRCDLPFYKYDIVDQQVYNQIINLIANPKEFIKLYAKSTEPKDLKTQISNLSAEKKELKTKLQKSFQIETNTNNADLLKIYKDERKKIEEKFTNVSNRLLKLTSELSFFSKRNEQLEKFQKVFCLNKPGDVIRARVKIMKMLKALPFSEKKKLIDAVISPETGGCVYIRRLSMNDLAPEDFVTGNDADQSVGDQSVGDQKGRAIEESLVIEMDFTLDPLKVTEIIQAIYKNHFNIDKL